MTANAFWRTTGRLLIVTGLTTLFCSGLVWARANYDKTTRANAPLPVTDRVEVPVLGRTLGRLEVPRLGLSTIVVQGDDQYSLLVGAGHLPETPLPWHDGNSVLAGHRDTDFRPLRNIREGDTIRFQTGDMAIEYVVRETSIVEPTDLTPLRATTRPTLTLITCYPFAYIGPAPKRFVVRAERAPSSRADAITTDQGSHPLSRGADHDP